MASSLPLLTSDLVHVEHEFQNHHRHIGFGVDLWSAFGPYQPPHTHLGTTLDVGCSCTHSVLVCLIHSVVCSLGLAWLAAGSQTCPQLDGSGPRRAYRIGQLSIL